MTVTKVETRALVDRAVKGTFVFGAVPLLAAHILGQKPTLKKWAKISASITGSLASVRMYCIQSNKISEEEEANWGNFPDLTEAIAESFIYGGLLIGLSKLSPKRLAPVLAVASGCCAGFAVAVTWAMSLSLARRNKERITVDRVEVTPLQGAAWAGWITIHMVGLLVVVAKVLKQMPMLKKSALAGACIAPGIMALCCPESKDGQTFAKITAEIRKPSQIAGDLVITAACAGIAIGLGKLSPKRLAPVVVIAVGGFAFGAIVVSWLDAIRFSNTKETAEVQR